ncbi:hypothetical protein RF55_25551 [Lasius niger]|uniref:Uncharacterized protein n=1 Tax=Lasius niger TaxID=67767 RepID=A0A0J7JU41_LASNI|nr:hypothetical protein RF55_25551 [Lasius niger]
MTKTTQEKKKPAKAAPAKKKPAKKKVSKPTAKAAPKKSAAKAPVKKKTAPVKKKTAAVAKKKTSVAKPQQEQIVAPQDPVQHEIFLKIKTLQKQVMKIVGNAAEIAAKRLGISRKISLLQKEEAEKR